VVLWDVATHKRLAEQPLPVEESTVGSVAFSPDSKTLAAGFGRGVVLWDVATRRRLADEPLRMKEGPVESVACSSDGKTLAAGVHGTRGGGGVVLWDVAALRRLADAPLPVDEGFVHSVAFSPDGKTLSAGFAVDGSASPGGGVVRWDVATHKRLAGDPLLVGEGHVLSVAFSPTARPSQPDSVCPSAAWCCGTWARTSA
jgi:WD40 repeat protein